MNAAAAEKCRGCAHYRSTAVFELCEHPSSEYVVAERHDFHTISHMRDHGACTPMASLFTRREEA